MQVKTILRDHHLHQDGGEDVLQLYLTLWYAWQHLNDIKPRMNISLLGKFKCPIQHCDSKLDSQNALLDHL